MICCLAERLGGKYQKHTRYLFLRGEGHASVSGPPLAEAVKSDPSLLWHMVHTYVRRMSGSSGNTRRGSTDGTRQYRRWTKNSHRLIFFIRVLVPVHELPQCFAGLGHLIATVAHLEKKKREEQKQTYSSSSRCMSQIDPLYPKSLDTVCCGKRSSRHGTHTHTHANLDLNSCQCEQPRQIWYAKLIPLGVGWRPEI